MKERVDLSKVENLIDRYELNTSNRNRSFVWKRSAVANFLRKHGLTTVKIGSLLGKDHATILHALKVYNNNRRYEDFILDIYEIECDLQRTFEHTTDYTDDICLNEMICLANLETLIKEKL